MASSAQKPSCSNRKSYYSNMVLDTMAFFQVFPFLFQQGISLLCLLQVEWPATSFWSLWFPLETYLKSYLENKKELELGCVIKGLGTILPFATNPTVISLSSYSLCDRLGDFACPRRGVLLGSTSYRVGPVWHKELPNIYTCLQNLTNPVGERRPIEETRSQKKKIIIQY